MAKPPMDQQRFSELLPFYLNQTLDADDKASMEQYLANHPEARLELKFDEFLRDAAKSIKPPRPESERLNELMRRLDHEREHSESTAYSGALGTAYASRLSEPGWSSRPVAVLMRIILWMLVIGLLILGAKYVWDHVISSASGETPHSVVGDSGLKLLIKPQAKMEDLVLTLRKVQGSLRAGPNESGEIWISVPQNVTFQQAEKLLQASPVIDSVVESPLSSFYPECFKK